VYNSVVTKNDCRVQRSGYEMILSVTSISGEDE